jgi:hypothetical protein
MRAANGIGALNFKKCSQLPLGIKQKRSRITAHTAAMNKSQSIKRHHPLTTLLAPAPAPDGEEIHSAMIGYQEYQFPPCNTFTTFKRQLSIPLSSLICPIWRLPACFLRFA